MKSTEEMEQPAKRWEIAALSTQMANQGELIKTVSTKLDVLIAQPHVKKEEVKEMIDDQIQDVHQKYGPMYDNAKKLIWAVVFIILGLVGDIAVRVWSLK